MEPVLDWEQRYRDATTAWERGELNPAFQALRPTFSENPGGEHQSNTGWTAKADPMAQLKALMS